ncbi:hypothetical protein KVR01_006525 [Diaporthe batatas]|uniref:uncharacterized protein n=1 Tax=Diaporthe batatas TaxID=748121 RepID=UPI001D03809E|nr:uncharacterized protein KVR01_006525 [Diaporthe batatas]KAG8163228.1 hypothetical protein KVR01_006525 [Diaporthe batatas]
MSGSVFSETLQQITDTKLDELSKKRAAFEEDKASALSSIKSQSDPIERLVLLSDGVKKSFGIKLDGNAKVTTGLTRHPRLEVQLKNLDRFLAQARQDPSVSTKTLSDWEKDLLRHLEVQSLKYQYASLYGQLVTEWLSGDQKSTAEKSEDTEMGDAFEDEWESKAFEPAHVDVGLLNKYLESVFGLSSSARGEDRNKKLQALQKLREAVQAFEVEISRPGQLDRYSLVWTIRGLMASDLLTNEKREVLKDFLGNHVILSEISDVLNLRLAALGSWKWGSDGVPVEQHRKISGVFAVQMHEDLLQSIFLQYIGVKWSVFFRDAFVSFRKEDSAWASLYKEIPELDKKRLEYYLGRVPRRRSLQKERQKIHSSDYFVAKLLKRVDDVKEMADGEVEAEYEEVSTQYRTMYKRRKVGARSARRARACPSLRADFSAFEADDYEASSPVADGLESDVDEDDEHNSPGQGKTLMQLKQQVVHLISTEVAINTRLHGELTAFHAVFEDWESLLPHETICTVLRFLGVSQHWLGFFEQYLQAPLRFIDEDQASSKVRRRGVPSSHALSDVLGETVLFCLDLAVNQAASGQPLWRYGDDLWFWSPNHNTGVDAWKAVERFTDATGTSVNDRKTGTVRISKDKSSQLSIDQRLPEGDIRWGFLFLSPQTGRFEIDHKMVDSHIDELRKQLNDKSSIFSFIQTWNAFAAKFFSSNFGKSANCFGRQHVDDMLATHKRIQQQIFSSGSGAGGMGKSSSIIDHLRKTIQQRFGIADVPDGYFYFPVALGGLDLQSPFIPLLQIRDSVLESQDKLFEQMLEAEKEAYNRFKHQFERSKVHRLRDGELGAWQPELKQDRDNFFHAAEFVGHREDLGVIPDEHAPQDLLWVFQQLMAQPTEESIDHVSELETALGEVPAGGQAIKPIWHDMDATWRWITAMYGPEIIERFGGLSIVDPGLLPMGMVGLLREKRVTWQG